MGQSQLVEVEYVCGSYYGKISVNASSDDDDTIIIAKAMKKLHKENPSTLVQCGETFKILSRKDI